MQKEISRREALKLGALGVGAGVLGASNLMAKSIDAKDVKFDEEYDVVIIGSGFAGLAAGITAAKRGFKTLIVEKMGRIGGNSTINGGIFAVPNSELQKKNDIKDSKKLFIDDCVKAGLGLNHVELLEILADRAVETFNFTLENGATYLDKLLLEGGHSVPRTYYVSNTSGSGIVKPLTESYQKLPNATLKTRVKFDNFILDDKDEIVGISVRENYKFDSKLFSDDNENTSGERKFIKAKRGVVLASGGFCSDKYFRKLQDPKAVEEFDTTNHSGATAGAMIEAFGIGAMPVQIGWIQYIPYKCPDEKGNGITSKFASQAAFRYGISVDPRTGKRYMNELADRKVRADAMFKIIDTKKDIYPINLSDSVAVSKLVPKDIENPLETGAIKKFDTLDELAKYYKIPADELKKTVEQYNSYVKAGKDPDFAKPMHLTDGITISKAPFYAMRGAPKLHHTMGGVKINTKAQVLNYQNKPIPRLYAAGEVTGGTHGASRLGSVAILDCLTFGMIAGENI
ncbi:flavocytochrome C flavin subunit [Campylobacter sputorum subsp. bubulus]|uniref:Flavocytochrome C flavin subunit n=1 Tax=Campylobacter sputorum subsp. sputorum TaxID=32024 RepID=A0A381DK72_9BACT|nr:flavocytochrome c [Campylobacter sputorum]ASM34340.1 flavocytochrome c [Campylobacter sputorum aubsp. sputorum RM3237]ASM36008.1 flavocytochrome c [Campylobacter sputorum bv. faecalis CCUG 20703]KAB0582268.1 flavocytochrome c [Campylobacter sputorum subsp. sputorum]QEL04531.1 flavocytochrome c [Campylobacter sputorum subsp. sputorum]SUX09307.1 flavocytochrome C flavin subunit [Campylobacter sputorum subsp. bubulus]